MVSSGSTKRPCIALLVIQVVSVLISRSLTGLPLASPVSQVVMVLALGPLQVSSIVLLVSQVAVVSDPRSLPGPRSFPAGLSGPACLHL